MFCGPKTGLMLSEATLMEFAIVIMLAGIPDVGRHVSRFCAYASDEEDETPAAKIRRSRKALARTREITAHLPDQNMGGGWREQVVSARHPVQSHSQRRTRSRFHDHFSSCDCTRPNCTSLVCQCQPLINIPNPRELPFNTVQKSSFRKAYARKREGRKKQ